MRELLAVRAAIQAATPVDRPPGSPAALVQVSPVGPELGKLHILDSGPLVLGRGAGPGVRVNDLSVSRAHANLEVLLSGTLVVTDLNSTNGTFINDTQVPEGEVYDGDFVRFGGCVFRFLAAIPSMV
jgi:pSer/pThr/pTyr-binding forkhead associated (FHA) protein